MARVLLINPPSPERLGAPLLGQQYVAASLIAGGHEVRVMDAAGLHARLSDEEILSEVESFRPHLTGFGLFTRWVWHAYGLARKLRGRAGWLVAGGAHPTVRPFEPLDHGFDISVTGEAEQTILDLARQAEAGAPVPASPVRSEFIEDLDSLPSPQLAQALYDPRWYNSHGRETIPGGILTSRGCPARCTFCANYVTGRGFRYRSASNVVAELNAYNRRTGCTFFPFWDDALTANVARLRELCLCFEEEIEFPLGWSAITRANMVTRDLLRAMKSAGCVSVNFGVESGDNEILRVIKKGVSTEHVVRALEWAKAEGLMTACNFMLGFPQETPSALEKTLFFMQRIAPMVDVFSTLGVVVPFPGTPLYEDFHLRYGFTDWWLKEEYSRYVPLPSPEEIARFRRQYMDDANLELDFFRYSPEMRNLIRDCLRYKAEHNLSRMYAAA